MLLSCISPFKGEPLLPTLGFILCAYVIFALSKAWTRRYRRGFHPYGRWQRRSRITTMGGAGVGAGVIILICILGLPSRYENLGAANIISASWGDDSWKAGQVMSRQEIPPLKTQGDSGLPVYAYLHPETPADQLLADNNALPARPGEKYGLRKPLTRDQASKVRAKIHHPKKNKVTSKHRTENQKSKKKTPSSSKKIATLSR